jgi:hypothetical protein
VTRTRDGRGSRRPAVVALALIVGLLLVAASLGWAAANDISTVAGTGTPGYNGDGIAATAAQLNGPVAVAPTLDGGYLIADQGNSRVRRVAPNGVISTVAGTGTAGFSGDGNPATGAQLNTPNGVAMTADGGILIADSGNHRVRQVSPNGIIATVAGTGAPGFNGDDIPATQGQLNFPSGVAAAPDGGFLIADNDNNRIRRVSPAGMITTVAGLGPAGYSGDGTDARRAQLNDPAAVAFTPDGGFLIADLQNHRIRRVSPEGIMSTAAGSGVQGFGGDGGDATDAQLNNPIDVAVTADGGYLIVDRVNNRVRRVSPSGTITTVAGTGTPGSAGDGGPATSAQLRLPIGVAATGEGDFLIADTSNDRVRLVDAGAVPGLPPGGELPPPALGKTVNVSVVSGKVFVAVPEAAAAGRGRATRTAYAAQKGLKFVRLTAAIQIPVGSFLNTRRGTVRLVSATGRAGKTQAGRFSAGLFQVRQSRRRSAKGLTSLLLKGSSFKSCRARRASGPASAARRSRRVVRRLRSRAKGTFRSRGRYAAATVRGTVWSTIDRCDGTLTKVTSGRVRVRDFRRRRTVTVRAGKRYLARAPG